MDLGLLIVRLVFGGLLVAHGAQKLFGWFGGSGLHGTASFFESLGFHPGVVFVVATALAECGGGTLFVLGLGQPAAVVPVIAVMVVAIATVHWSHGLLGPAGVEVPLLYAAAAMCLAFTGPGALSLDARFGLIAWWTAPVAMAAIAIGMAAGLASLGLRRRAARFAHA